MARRHTPALLVGTVLAAALMVVLAFCSGSGIHREAGGCPTGAGACVPSGSPAGSAPPSGAVGGDAAPGGSGSTGRSATAGAGSGSAAPTANSAVPPAHCAGPGACGFPDASTTGARIPLTPHTTGALSIHADGTVISGWDITGSLDIYANNVTVIDSRITSTNWWGINLRAGYSGLRVLHTTITAVPGKGQDNGGEDYAVSNMGGSSVEVGWSDISVFGDALSMGQGYLHDNYVHDITPFKNLGGEWQHTDAVISDGGNSGTLVIRHNTLLNPVSADQGASASIGLFADTGVVANSVVDDNWLAGGAYALYGGNTGARGIQVTGNVFSPQYHSSCGVYGTVTAWNTGGAGNVWRNNRMQDGTPVNPGPAS
ncbi:hypothetical protein [Streptacidiphilus sp. EB129]|uniref:hypothetical protein n=1 Tax=Streptacidiphilus sp. EB129 TaxID=3156262 RepID=UPI003519B774